MHLVYPPPPPPPPTSPQILYNNSFQFLLGITVVPREIEDSGYSISFFFGVGGGNKMHCGPCENGEWQTRALAIRGRLGTERTEGGGVRASVYLQIRHPRA